MMVGYTYPISIPGLFDIFRQVMAFVFRSPWGRWGCSLWSPRLPGTTIGTMENMWWMKWWWMVMNGDCLCRAYWSFYEPFGKELAGRCLTMGRCWSSMVWKKTGWETPMEAILEVSDLGFNFWDETYSWNIFHIDPYCHPPKDRTWIR